MKNCTWPDRSGKARRISDENTKEVSKWWGIKSPLEMVCLVQHRATWYRANDMDTAVAQISLAEILLKLNIGLVGIINSFLHGDKNSLRLDYRSLTDLSERSRMDTCRTLRQLHRRSMHVRLPPTVVPHNAPHPGSQDPTEADRKRKGRSMNKPARIRGPTLARITIQGAQSSQIALVKPVERRNKSASMSDLSKVRSGVSTPLSRPSPHADALIAPQPRPMAIRSHTLPGAPRPRGKQSTSRIDVTSQHPARKDMHRAGAQSTFGLAQLRTSKPDTGPVPAMGPQHRSPIPTYYSVASNGTKLGEIPLHKWAEHFDFDAMSAVNRETENNEWPLVDLTDRKKRRFNFLGMFRRKEKLPG